MCLQEDDDDKNQRWKGTTCHFQVNKKKRMKLAYMGKFKTGMKKAVEYVNSKRCKIKMTKTSKNICKDLN